MLMKFHYSLYISGAYVTFITDCTVLQKQNTKINVRIIICSEIESISFMELCLNYKLDKTFNESCE